MNPAMVARKDKKEKEAKERIKMVDKKMASKLDLKRAVKKSEKKDMKEDKKMMGNAVLKKCKGDKY